MQSEMHHLYLTTELLDIFDFITGVSRFNFFVVCLFVVFSAAFGGMQPLGRSPMRSSRRSLSYTSIKAVIDSVSNYFSVPMLTVSWKKF